MAWYDNNVLTLDVWLPETFHFIASSSRLFLFSNVLYYSDLLVNLYINNNYDVNQDNGISRILFSIAYIKIWLNIVFHMNNEAGYYLSYQYKSYVIGNHFYEIRHYFDIKTLCRISLKILRIIKDVQYANFIRENPKIVVIHMCGIWIVHYISLVRGKKGYD